MALKEALKVGLGFGLKQCSQHSVNMCKDTLSWKDFAPAHSVYEKNLCFIF